MFPNPQKNIIMALILTQGLRIATLHWLDDTVGHLMPWPLLMCRYCGCEYMSQREDSVI